MALTSLGCADVLGIGDFDDATTSSGGAAGAGGSAGSGGGGAQGGAEGGAAVGPTLAWAGLLSGPGQDKVWGLDVDPSGKVGLCGPFESNFVLQVGDDASAPLQSSGATDLFALELDSEGGLVWASSFGGGGEDTCADLAFDDLARAHLTGVVRGIVDFDGHTVDAGAAQAAYVATLDGDGAALWASQLSPSSVQETFDVDVDPSGRHWVAGALTGSATFDGAGPIDASPSTRAGFVASETPAGQNELTGIGAGGAADGEEQQVFAVHAQSSSRVWVGGRSAGQLGVGSYTATTDSPAGNGFIAALDGDSALTWIVGLRSPDLAQVHGLATDGDGDLWAVGMFTSTLTVDQAAPLVGHGDRNDFVLELPRPPEEVNPTVSITLGREGAQEARDLAIDWDDNVYVVVNFFGAIDVDGQTRISRGSSDALLVSWDRAGQHRFHVWLTSEREVFASAVAVHGSSNRVVVGGYFGGTLRVRYDDRDLGTPLDASAGADAPDGFVLAFDVPPDRDVPPTQ